jgi:hypothetical protein
MRSNLADKIFDRFIARAGFHGGYSWSSLKRENGGRSEVPHSQSAVIERLVSAGTPAARPEAAALMQSGRADLLEQVVTGQLTVARARRIARQRGPR